MSQHKRSEHRLGNELKQSAEKIKKSAEDGHNEEVMQSVACHENEKYHGKEKRNFMLK